MHLLAPLTVLASLAQLGLALPYVYKQDNESCATPLPPSPPLVLPPACVPIAPTPGQETDKRAFRYGNAFIVDKDLVDAFTFISDDYVNHHPGAEAGGRPFAFSDLSVIWPPSNISVKRQAYKGEYSWLNYLLNGTEIVDRYRWESGCIVEHWDAGEVFPSDEEFVEA